MTKKKINIVIWLLVGSCALNLVLAFNAGQKRKAAVSRLDNINAQLAEIELRYDNAVQSYDALAKKLQDAKKELGEQQLFSESLKEALQKEQIKCAALAQGLEKLKDPAAAKPAEKSAAAATNAQPQGKKSGRVNKLW